MVETCILFASPIYDPFVDMAVKWAVKWTGQNKILHSVAFKQHRVPAHLALEGDSVKAVRSQHVLKNVKKMGGKPGRGLSHFGHPLEIWVKKRWREPLKSFRLLDFHRLSGQASPSAWTSSTVSWYLPLQPSLAPAQQRGLMYHCAWCSQQVLAVGGFWVVNWEAYVHCNAKDTSSAKPQQGPVPLFFPSDLLSSI